MLASFALVLAASSAAAVEPARPPAAPLDPEQEDLVRRALEELEARGYSGGDKRMVALAIANAAAARAEARAPKTRDQVIAAFADFAVRTPPTPVVEGPSPKTLRRRERLAARAKASKV
jgi:hypothetical protein